MEVRSRIIKESKLERLRNDYIQHVINAHGENTPERPNVAWIPKQKQIEWRKMSEKKKIGRPQKSINKETQRAI